MIIRQITEEKELFKREQKELRFNQDIRNIGNMSDVRVMIGVDLQDVIKRQIMELFSKNEYIPFSTFRQCISANDVELFIFLL